MVRTLLGTLCALLVLAPAAHASWSPPALLSGCPPVLEGAPVREGARAPEGAPAGEGAQGRKGARAPAPLIVYPSSEPQVRSGAGALLWNAGCAGGVPEAFQAPLGAGGLPRVAQAVNGREGTARPSRGGTVPVGLAAVSAAVGTTAGQVLAVGSARGGVGAFVELSRGFSAPRSLGGSAELVAAASGYLGDAVVVSLEKGPPRARWMVAVRVQRHYRSVPQPPLRLSLGGSAPDALVATLDFRSDVLLVWAAHGAIYARELTQRGVAEPVRRVAGVAGVPELRALYSDDGRAIVAWREQRGPSTSIRVDISDAALRFGAAETVERFVDPPRLVTPLGSLRLVRLSSEAVMMAWTGMRAGRYVVCASPVSLRRGVWAPVVVSGSSAVRGLGDAPGAVGSSGSGGSLGSGGARPAQALLADLVPGPRAEVLALWTAAPLAPDGKLDPRRRLIAAAWGHYGGHGEARFAVPEAVSAAGPNGTPAAAFDPQNDRALAAWVTGEGTPRIAYAQRSAGPPAGVTAARSYRPASAVHRTGTSRAGRGVRPVWLSALGLLLLATAGAVRQLSARRRGIRGPRGPARWEGRLRVPRDRPRRPPRAPS